jgi:hypothetical protein
MICNYHLLNSHYYTNKSTNHMNLINQRSLDDAHLVQSLNYLEPYKLETCLLINFGSRSIEFKKVTNEKNLA